MSEKQGSKHHPQPEYLPVSLEELEKIGVDRPDIILVSGDGYLDHPASATALLGRSLWNAGYISMLPKGGNSRGIIRGIWSSSYPFQNCFTIPVHN